MQVFLTSPWVPPEWVNAHGLEPRGIWSLPGLGLPSASLAAGVCAFAQSVRELVKAQPAAAVVFTTHCDQLRRGYDAAAAARTGNAFLFNLPATWQTPVARKIFASELARLREFLVRLGGRPPTARELIQAIEASDAARARLLEAADWCPPRLYAEAIASFHWDGSLRLPPAEPGNVHQHRPVPVALIGGPLPRTYWNLFDLIESCGGHVAVNGTEAGERSLGARNAGDTQSERGQTSSEVNSHADGTDTRSGADFLARRFVENCADVFQRPNTPMYAWLERRFRARGVRGIVVWHFVGCDLWRAEATSLRDAFGLPVLLLEAEDIGGLSPRISGRVQAFMEALK